MDETTLAFEKPEARAVATSKDQPLDRISVRDYTKSVEIGAFQSERDVEQRVRFNVVLEVARHDAAASDDVDKVLSYDTIVEAIEEQMANERINLLETLAERIAEAILRNRQAVRVFVRIEKLDRVPGTLGVEIVRSRADGHVVTEQGGRPLVVFLPNAVMHSERLRSWLDRIAAHDLPAIICVEPVEGGAPRTGVEQVDLRLGLLSMEQNAWILASLDKRCVVAGSRTELDWALKNGQLSVWAPSRIVLDAVIKPEADTALAIAQWFAQEFSDGHVLVCEGHAGTREDGRFNVVLEPRAL